MKRTTTRRIGLLLAILLLAGLVPTAALAAPEAPERVIAAEVEMVSQFAESQNAGSYTDTCYYSDSWFLADSAAPNAHLATLSAMASSASQSDEDDMNGRKISALLDRLGFADVQMNAYYRQGIMLEDSIGCIIGRRTLTDADGQTYTLLAVFPRSGGYQSEWVGNFKLGASGLHQGFRDARDEMLRFMKKYIGTQQITGALKVWIAGYSRGAAVANLLGGFLAEDTGYFGAGVSLAPEDLFVYTIATPLTIPENVTKADALCVSGARGEGFSDTPGAAAAYTGTDAQTPIVPGAARYQGIHNYAASGDYVTKLPPAAWGFTRYGTTETVTYGGAEMLEWLSPLSPGTAAMLAEANYETPLPYKTLDFNTLSLVDANGTISVDDLLDERVAALVTLAGSRDALAAQGYTDVLGAATAIFGVDWNAFYTGITGAETGALVKAGALNYLAYALEQQGVEDSLAGDNAGVTAALIQLLKFAGVEIAVANAYTAQEFFEDLADILINHYQTKETAKARAEVIAGLLPEKYAQLYLALLEYAKESNLQPKDFDGLLYLIASFACIPENAELTQSLASELAKVVPEEYAGALPAAASYLTGNTYPEGEEGLQAAILDLVKGCATGFPDAGWDADFFRLLLRALLASNFDGQEAISNLIYPEAEAETSDPVPFGKLVEEVLDLLLEDEENEGGQRSTVRAAADASLSSLLEAGKTQRTAPYINVLQGKTAKLRQIAAVLLFDPQGGYDPPQNGYDPEADLRSAATLIDRAAFLYPAHDNRLYVSLLKTRDSNYSLALSGEASFVPAEGSKAQGIGEGAGDSGAAALDGALQRLAAELAEKNGTQSLSLAMTVAAAADLTGQNAGELTEAQRSEQAAQAAIKRASGDPALEFDFLSIDVTQYIIDRGPAEISDTNRVLEIPLRWDLTGVYNPRVYRWHDGAAETLRRLSARPTDYQDLDGTFYVAGSGADAVIYLYSRRFSTYAVAVSAEETYTVFFEAGGGTGTMENAAAAGAYVLPACAFTAPAGKYFVRWQIGDARFSEGETVSVGGDTVVTAVWQDIPYVPSDLPSGAEPAADKQTNPFTDVAETDAFFEAVLWAYAHTPQITTGVTETTFAPHATVKRGEAITFLWRAMGCPEPTLTAEDCPFTDLTEDYYKKAILWGYETGIVKGVTDTEFAPELTLSTAHIATFLYRTLNPGADGWYELAAAWAAESGCWDGITLAIDSETDCPRAQVVMALYALREQFDKAA